MDYTKEVEGKRIHDNYQYSKNMYSSSSTTTTLWVQGPIIVGGGPSGVAAAACLKERGIPSLILERSSCIASLWQYKTYDRLRLHLPKQFCELPFMSFPSNFPTYPTKQNFVSYINTYVKHFKLEIVYNCTVVTAEFDVGCGFWRVKTIGLEKNNEEIEYVSHWLIVATGENAQEFVPHFEGIEEFIGPVFHTSSYTSGELFQDKDVLVVGCGNSGMEVSLDLCNHNARPSLVVRDTVHVLPQEMLGRSTFGVSMELLKWFPIRFVDTFLLVMSRIILGNTAKLGLHRPKLGPLELKCSTGKTPVLDIGTLVKIRTGNIKVMPGIKRLFSNSVEFIDGIVRKFDAVILATGYRSNVPTWLKENKFFSEKDGFPKASSDQSFSNNTWKGDNGLYAIGFSKKGLLGTSIDANKIAEDLQNHWIINSSTSI